MKQPAVLDKLDQSLKRQIWKYQLRPGHNEIEMPQNALALHADLQNGIPCLWAEVNPEAQKEKVNFLVVGTGHSIPYDFNHLDTWQDGEYVWHLYIEITEPF